MDGSTLDTTHPPSRQQAAVGGSGASSKATHAPSAKLWKQISMHRTIRPLLGPPRATSLRSISLTYRGYVGGPAGPACTVSGCQGAAQPSRWLLWTIWLGFAIQFARRPHSNEGSWCPCLVRVSLSYWWRTSETGPSSQYEGRVFQPLHHCAREKRWVTTNLGSAHLELGLSWTSFQDVHAEKCIFGCIHPRDRSAAVDLKDPYFHVSIFPCHRSVLRLAFEGWAYQYKVLPFRLSLSPRVFTKVAEAALVPLREQGVRILNYLNDWLILAQSQDQLCEHRDLVLSHLIQLGLWVNWEKTKLFPMQRISFLGMKLDSVNQIARFTQERAQSVLNYLNTFKSRTVTPLHHSTSPRGGRPSPRFALSRPSIEMLRWQDAKLQDLRPALCLPRKPAEGECRLQAEDGPLDSGRNHPGLSSTECALPIQFESSLYKKCGILLGTGSWPLADRYM